MRILFLLPDFPYPASTGGRSKIFNILKHMSMRHQCDILCFGNLDQANIIGLIAALPNVRVLGIFSPVSGVSKWVGMLWNLVRGLPPSMASFAGHKYVAALKDCLTRCDYDVVHYDIINMAKYFSYGCKISSVHSPNDATSSVYFLMAKRAVWPLEKIRLLIAAILLRRFERTNYRFFSKIHVVSKADASYLLSLDTKVDVVTIPIAIDELFLRKVDLQNEDKNVREKNPRIVCTGNLINPAIAQGVKDFLDHALPIIMKKKPNVSFVFLGQNVSKTLQRRLISTSNVEFLTWVEDYRAFLADADVVLVPDIVGPQGAKTRTVQAMGLGLPVVGTEAAFAGIPFVNREHGLLYRTMPECAELILHLLDNRSLREDIGEKAHQIITDEFSINATGVRFENLYQKAIEKFHSRCPDHCEHL